MILKIKKDKAEAMARKKETPIARIIRLNLCTIRIKHHPSS